MPRKKQGQGSRVEEPPPEPSGVKVKKKTDSGVATVCNEATGKTISYKNSLCKTETVPATVASSSTQNGTLHLAVDALSKGENSAARSSEVSPIHFSESSCSSSDGKNFRTSNIDEAAIENAISLHNQDDIAANMCVTNSNEDIKTKWGSVLSSCDDTYSDVESCENHCAGSTSFKRSGVSVITLSCSSKEVEKQIGAIVYEHKKSDSSLIDVDCNRNADVNGRYGDSLVNHISDCEQANYRVSTTITQTKPCSINNDNSNLVTNCTYTPILKDQQQCRLPSSVYGTPSSNIEKVLTGLHLEESNHLQNSFTLTPEISIPEHGASIKKNLSGKGQTFSTSHAKITMPCSEVGLTKATDEPYIVFNRNQSNQRKEEANQSVLKNKTITVLNHLPKLHIPDPLSSDESNSSQHTSELQKQTKFPKITSPQILEQHISKIISQNAAIVETLDPLWSKRYFRQSSQNTDSENVGKKSGSKVRCMSGEKLIPSLNSDGGPSKLQCALLGTLNPETHSSPFLWYKGEKTVITSATSFNSNTVNLLSNNGTHPKIPSCSAEDELKGSAIKSLLCLKQGQFVQKRNSFSFSQDTYSQHPQNPEGSIIKDLLLKTKFQAKSSEPVDSEICRKADNFSSTSSSCTEEVYTCVGCGSKYDDEKLFTTHKALCENSSTVISSTAASESKSLVVSDGFFSSKFSAVENMPILNPSALSSSIEDLLKKDSSGMRNADECVGHILKSQLLSPLPIRRSPPLKKRKISEPIILSNPHNNDSAYKTSSLNTKYFDGNNLISQRCRSQSVHLFGGEVQICDGAKTKRMKIGPNLPESICLRTTIPNSSSSAKYPLDFKSHRKDNVSLSSSVVTIAQPVHNSGGTVTHVPVQDSPSIFSPLSAVPLANPAELDSITERKKDSVFLSTSSSIMFPYNSYQVSMPFINNNSSILRESDGIPIIQKMSICSEKSTLVDTDMTESSLSFHNIKKTGATLSEESMSSKLVSMSNSQAPFCDLEKLGIPSDSMNIPNTGNLTIPAESNAKEKHGLPCSDSTKQDNISISPVPKLVEKQSLDAPTITLTPCSPTFSNKGISTRDEVDSKQKFLAPARPTSLPLKKKPFTMVGSTLISPDTPRPKKSCRQLYINGQAYTYLGLKCSTRSTYCCIYRPQPMFVLQETDPKLSMYSNWQVVPAKEELCGMTPGQMMSFYNSRQSSLSLGNIYTMAKLGEPLSFTHSSYWTFRSQKRVATEHENFECQSLKDLTDKTINDVTDQPVDCFQTAPEQLHILSEESVIPSETASLDRKTESLSENTSSLDIEASVSDTEGNNTHDDDDDDDDKTEVNTDSSQSQPPKRVKIFEGGFKSNEDYTYVRGRGRGKYVCEECGIRCKKPSMLKKHIRTHTDLRPYKCRHCSFAFKTKGNLTKHMKSKAHHKKCTELGISPVLITSDDSQIDEETHSKQENLKGRNFNFSDGDDIDDEDDDDFDDEFDDSDALDDEYESDSSSMANKHLSAANGHSIESDSRENALNDMDVSSVNPDSPSQCSVEQEAARSLLHLSSLTQSSQWSSSAEFCSASSAGPEVVPTTTSDRIEGLLSVSPVTTSVLMSTAAALTPAVKRSSDQSVLVQDEPIGHRPRSYSADVPFGCGREHLTRHQVIQSFKASGNCEAKDTSEFSCRDSSTRRYSISVAREARKPCIVQSPLWAAANSQKSLHIETLEQPMDLRITRGENISHGKGFFNTLSKADLRTMNPSEGVGPALNSEIYMNEPYSSKKMSQCEYDISVDNSNNSFAVAPLQEHPQLVGNSSYSQSHQFYPAEGIIESSFASRADGNLTDGRQSPELPDLSVCSPVSPVSVDETFLSHESSSAGVTNPDGLQDTSRSRSDFMSPGTSASLEDGKCICRICNKIFAKAGQLRIHVNIHYFERPFRCDNCGVSFRTKGHLQKHKRSVSHYNKVNMNMTFGTPSVDNPRPFKCADCKIAFRIHGHLAKHLRSKMHIMKLECLGKLPFGMYAEMERSGVSLNEIDTTDCNNSLESLQVMAQKLYQRDPRRMRWHSPNHDPSTDVEAIKCPTQATTVSDTLLPVPDQLSVALSSPSAIAVPVPSIINVNPTESDVKHEPSDSASFQSNSAMVGLEMQTSAVPHYSSERSATVSEHLTRSVEGGENESTVSLHRSDTCHICGRMFKSAKFLQVHLYCDHSSWNTTSSEVPTKNVVSTPSPRQTVIAQELVCDLCRRHFPNQNTLQQHLLTHAQPRPFVCEVCDAGFTSSASLVSHLATHQSSDIRISE